MKDKPKQPKLRFNGYKKIKKEDMYKSVLAMVKVMREVK